jgi:hypothetical protein
VRRLLLLAVALASVAAAPNALGAPLVLRASVAPGAQTATLDWTSSRPVRLLVEYGRAPDYGVWARTPQRARASGRVLIGGLEPGSSYWYRAIARAGPRRTELWGSFVTKPTPPWVGAVATRNGIFLDGQPFFPRMAWRVCEWGYPPALAVGINLFVGNQCDVPWLALKTLDGRAFSAVDSSLAGAFDERGLVGWYQPDEPDLRPTESLVGLPPSRQTKRVTFLTLSNHFFSGAEPLPQGRSMYPGLIATSDMIGFDLYPLQAWCRPDRFDAVYDAQRELVALAAPRPTYQWIEVAPMSQCGPGLEPTAATVRAETWLAIAGGAKGIGFFPSAFSTPIAGELAQVSAQIASLAPALDTPAVAVSTSPARPVVATARRANGATYVVAVNTIRGAAGAAISVPGLRAGRVWVLGEGRSVRARGGVFSDGFASLETHVYVAPPRG